MNYHTFNLTEALFWIALGLLGYSLRNLKERKYKQLAVYASVVLIAFGLSDVAEILYGSFLGPNNLWLLTWKIINVSAIIYGFGWYLRLRMQ